MALSIHTNEPSPLNTTICGSLINLTRGRLTQAEGNGIKKVEMVAINRFFHLAGAFLLGLSSGIEASARILVGLVACPIYLACPDSTKTFMKENAKATLIALKLFSVTINPLSLVSFVALSILPKSFIETQMSQESKESLRSLGHQAKIGSCALTLKAQSFLDATFCGKKINSIRKSQTDFESTLEGNLNKTIISRISTFTQYLVLGLAAGFETTGSLLALLGYGTFTRGKQLLTSCDDLTKIHQNENLIELARKFFTSLIIFSNAIDPKFWLITALEHAHPDAYTVPDETKQLMN